MTNSQAEPDQPSPTPKPAATAQNPLAILFGALGLAFACDHLFYGHLPGISVAIFWAVYVAVFTGIALRNAIRIRFANLWPLPFFFFFAAMVAVRENEFLTIVNVLAVFSGVIFLPFYIAAGSLNRIGLLSGAVIPVRVGWATIFAGVHLRSQLKAKRERDTAERVAKGEDGASPGAGGAIFAHWGGVLRGVLLALPVLLIFGALLASADQIFAETLARIFSVEILDWILRTIGSTFRIALLAWFAAGALVYALLQRPGQSETTPFEDDIHGMTKMLGLAFVETVTVLSLVNLLFAGFIFIQLGYLFGGVEYLATTKDFNHADYARSGFFELVITAVLVLIFVLAAQRLSKRETGRQERWFQILTAVLLACVLVLLISAYRRMALYEATFGYTELRLLVYVFIAWLAALLCWKIGAILLGRPQYAVAGMVGAALGFLTTINAINPDAFIVARNVDRQLNPSTEQLEQEQRQLDAMESASGSRSLDLRIERDTFLDVSYLDSLSNDAVPELLNAMERLKADPAASARIKLGLERRLAELREQESLWKLEADPRPGWQSWHYGRARVRAALDAFAESEGLKGIHEGGNPLKSASPAPIL